MPKRIKILLNSSFFIMLMLMVSKILGLLRDSLIAKNYGLSYMNDIYMFSIGTTMLFISISYGITAALIPIHTNVIKNKTIEGRNKFISSIINIIFLISLGLSLICIIGARGIIDIFAPTFKENLEIYDEATMLLRIMFISFIFVGVQSVITAVLQCHKQFIITTLMPIISTTIYIIYLLFFINFYGLLGFGVASVLGFMSMFIINIPPFVKLGYRFHLCINLKDENFKKLRKNMVLVIITSSLVQINVFTVRAFAGRLYVGAISSLDYANKINMLVYEVFAQAITIVIFPTLAAYVSNKDIRGFKKELVSGINFMLIIMIPAAIGLFILRVPFITVFLKRGVFGNKEVLMTASVLVFYIPTMLAYGIRDILNRGFFSIDNTVYPMVNSIINAIINILICTLFINAFSAEGLSMANSLAVFIALFLSFIEFNKKVNGLAYKSIFKNIFKTVLSGIVMGISVYLLKLNFSKILADNLTGNLIIIIVSVVSGIVIYTVMQMILKTEDFIKYMKLLKTK